MIIGWQNVIYEVCLIFTSILLFGLSIFTYLNNKKAKDSILISLVLLFGSIFTASQVIGMSVSDSYISRFVFMFSLVFFWIGAFQIHAIQIYIGKVSKKILIPLYSFVSIATIVFAIFPNLYLERSLPLLYFKNYYNPGAFNIVEIIFVLALCLPYCTYLLYSSIKNDKDIVKKRHRRYFVYALSAYAIISHIPFLSAHVINIDPLYSVLVGIVFTLFIAYKIEQDEIESIKSIIKQSLHYFIGVISFGIVITTIYYFQLYIFAYSESVPIWVIPLAFSFIFFTVLTLTWRYMHRGEVMKGEFMSVVTHKLRAPLTHIRWASENLSKSPLSKEQSEQVGYIMSANEKILELTDTLVNISNTEHTKYLYNFERNNLTILAKDVVDTVVSQFESKKIRLITHYEDMLPVNIDMARIRFVMQTFIENAIHYTPEDSEIEIYCYRDDKYAVFSVRDNGIGISKDELPMLFRKFYRGKKAKASDSEGMGIALFMSREILDMHKGRIWAESKGVGMGSTFNFALPISHS